MSHLKAILIMLLASSSLSWAQDSLLQLRHLTPGSPDYIYPKTLLNTYWNQQKKFCYTLPEDTAQAAKADQWRNPAQPDSKVLKQMVEDWRKTLPEAEGIVYGESVHRNEFGIDGGIFWNQTYDRMAFYRMDESMVQSYPLVQTDDREATVRWSRYPMAGMTSHQVTLGIYTPGSKETIYLDTNHKPGHDGDAAHLSLNDPEHYLTCISWRPDGSMIFIAELNRHQNFMELNAYSATTGQYIGTLLTLSHPKYVEPEHPLYFLPGSNDRFIWQNESDGYDHLYLYDLSQWDPASSTQLRPVRQLTQGEWVVTQTFGADPKARNFYFMATRQSPKERHLYSVDLRDGTLRQLTHEPGIHNVRISPDYTEFYDAWSGPTTPRVCQLVQIRSGRAKVLYTAADPYQGYWRPEVEVGTLTAADSITPLYYRLVKPRGYDEAQNAGRRFPVVVYLYNGPHAQLVTDGYEYGLPGWDAYMASQGYAVFTIDGRGSDNRGLAFEQAIWHHLGEVEAADQLEGVKYLKSLSYIDPERIGIYGWSYGGFMTTYMKLNYPDIFKVGVCGGPVLDWSRYEVMYGERYMGTPQDNPEGYAANCLIHQAGKLRGKLLIIHDDQDDTVVPQMSVQFLKNSVEEGTYPDFMLYANHKHNVRGKDRVHLLTRIAQYFFDHL
ncbi:MAG: S9 family peptidase [Bacteroidales bacterium]|nr:S9 family peptidase [Bacteroidales bacterium]